MDVSAAISPQDDPSRYSTADHAVPKKPIFLIGGAPGTGKSTLAARVSDRLMVDHRIGTGFIRAVVQSETSALDEPDLFSMTFQADDPVAHLELQAARLQGAVMACVDRARREGTSLVVEGSHLIPALYARVTVDLFVVLGAPAPDEHLSRLRGATHVHRSIDERDWSKVQELDRYYRQEAERWRVPLVVFQDLEAMIALLEGDRSGPPVRKT
jgi:2-phosphoglycerate kinase